MIQTGFIADPNVRVLGQKYHEEFTGITGTDITLSYQPAATADGVVLMQVYRNGSLIAASGGLSGGTQVREVRVLAGDISALTSDGAGTAFATTVDVHHLATGDTVAISGASQPQYDVIDVVTVTGAHDFNYPITGTPVTPATGAPTWAAQSFSLEQTPTDEPELLFMNGVLQNPSTYTRSGARITLSTLPIATQTYVVWYRTGGGGYSVSGKTLTFEHALTSGDQVVVDYQYRN